LVAEHGVDALVVALEDGEQASQKPDVLQDAQRGHHNGRNHHGVERAALPWPLRDKVVYQCYEQEQAGDPQQLDGRVAGYRSSEYRQVEDPGGQKEDPKRRQSPQSAAGHSAVRQRHGGE